MNLETILVTGGCGYIGSHVSAYLLANGFNVLIIDSLVNSDENTIIKLRKISNSQSIKSEGKLSFKKGDLKNRKFLDKVFNECKKKSKPIKSVIHLAGLKSISSSLKEPFDYWDKNISATLSLLSSMRKFNCFSIVFSSSASVYKPSMNNLLKESDELIPTNPYGNSKLTIEKILNDLSLFDKNKWRIASLRYFNPAGSHPSGLLEEIPKGEPLNLFPILIRVIKKKDEKFFIFGKDWPTHDGTCIRDFIHVMDLAEAHIAALEYLLSNEPKFIALNIGRGLGTSILELIKTFKEIDINIPFKFVDKRNGDEPFVVADNSLALSLLQWEPKRSLKDICKDYINLKV